jgi:hypothetical protein
MRYVVRSSFVKEFDSLADRLKPWLALHRIVHLFLRLLLPLAWLGLLFSCVFVCSLPFQILHWRKIAPPSRSYWITATIVSALILFAFYRLGRRMRFEMKQGILDVETIIGFAGFVLSLLFTALIFRTGWLSG